MLERICTDKRRHIAACKTKHSFEDIDARARSADPVRPFAAALANAVASRSVGLIAEIKKASPSRGLIRSDFDPPVLARAYEAGGATCLSVLTDTPYFQGGDEYLTRARAACRLPVLRKDFMLDPYQIAEARALGADCILLILAALSDETAEELAAAARTYGMDVLAEVHNRSELERALCLPVSLIGINNRNLKTLSVDLAVSESLAPLVPSDRMVVSESGLSTPADLARLAAVGVRCYLVGDSLMRQSDVTAATRRLLAADARAFSARPESENAL